MTQSKGIGLGLSNIGNRLSRYALALMSYAVNGKTPVTVADFKNGKYSGTLHTRSDLEYTGNSNGTMTDSDGLIKWKPHNVLMYSEDFSNASWVKTSPSVATGTNQLYFPSTEKNIYQSKTTGISTNDKYKFEIELSGTPGETITIFVARASGGTYEETTKNVTLTADETTYEVEHTFSTSFSGVLAGITRAIGDTAEYVTANKATLHRSDLGGMKDNPDTGNSYVMTDSSDQYLRRDFHHIWNGTYYESMGTLIEPIESTNYVMYSYDLTQYWVSSNLSTIPNSIIAPDGSMNGTFLKEDTTLSQHNFTYAITPLSDEVCFSLYLKAGTRGTIKMTPGISGVFAVFNAISGDIISSAYCTPRMEDVGNGWYRCSMQFNDTGANTSRRITLRKAGVSGSTYQGDGVSGLYLWGVQLERGYSPTSYIPTNGSTVTRISESLVIPYEKISPYTTDVSFGIKGYISFEDDSSDYDILSWGTSAPYIKQGITTAGTYEGNSRTIQVDSLSASSDLVESGTGTYVPDTNVQFSIASYHSSDAMNLATDGTALTEINPVDLEDLSSTDLNLAYSGISFILSEFVMWDKTIEQAGIEEYTS